MAKKGEKHRFHRKNVLPKDPAVRRFGEWLPENVSFYNAFHRWLKETGYSASALNLYGVAARQVIGFLDQPYWTIDPTADIERAWQHIASRPLAAGTLADYHKGVFKFAEFVCLRCRKPPAERPIRWEYYLDGMPDWLQTEVRAFLRHRQRSWPNDQFQHKRLRDTLGHLTQSLRWMAAHFTLDNFCSLTPQVWYAYLDFRLESGISFQTVNSELGGLKHLVHYARENEMPICERFLLVDYLDEAATLPKDVPLVQLRCLQQEIQAEAQSKHTGRRRIGRLDLAWFLLMLHSGLRTGEVRALRLQDVDWEGRRVRIERAKGMKDRIVYLSQATIAALQSYLEVRGPADALPQSLFIFRHQPLSPSYCGKRLASYGKRCGFHVTPHQLRHSCATLLLNAGAPVLAVQNLLGHKWVDTTLGYARLYDGTVAADYYQAMATVERRLSLPEDRLTTPLGVGQLVALVDSLHQGTLNPTQADVVRQLRAGLMVLAENEGVMAAVDVLDEMP